MFAQALRLLGTRRAFVVHGHEGLDEISVCAPTRVSELRDGQVRTYDITPDPFFGQQASPQELRGGTAEDNAAVTRGILDGSRRGAARDVVLINAAAALTAAAKAADFSDGLSMAAAAIDEGRALEKLNQLIQYTRDNT
jgi:anthranilate phosphoribosyltransferase